jgi:hypothetical protein
MSDLIPFASGEVGRTRRDIKIALLKLDGLAEFNDRTAEYLVDLDRRRQLRAQADPGLQPIMADLLLNFYLDAVALQHGMYRRH